MHSGTVFLIHYVHASVGRRLTIFSLTMVYRMWSTRCKVTWRYVRL